LQTFYAGIYDSIIFISPTFQHQRKDLWDQLDGAGISVYPEITDALLKQLMGQFSDDKKKFLLILDDNGDQIKAINQKIMSLFIGNRRHLGAGVSVIGIFQRVSQCPTMIRRNADCFIVFGASSYSEREIFYRECSIYPNPVFQKMFTKATEEKFSCMVAVVKFVGQLMYYASDFKTRLLPDEKIK